MSLLVLFALFLISVLIVSNVRQYDDTKPLFYNFYFYLYLAWFFFLLSGFICCIGFGVFHWLKEGVWLTVNPEYLLSFLNEENFFKELLLSETNWLGVQKLSEWYLEANLAWSFFITIVFAYALAVAYSHDSE